MTFDGAPTSAQNWPAGRDYLASLLSLSTDLPTVSIPAGETLIEQGTATSVLYVLVEGRLTIERDGAAFAQVETPGAVFGEMAIVMGRPATASVRAAVDSTLRVAEDAYEFLSRPGVAISVLRLSATRLDSMTQYLMDVRAQFGGLDNHLGMLDGVLATLLHRQAPAARPGSARDPQG